MKNDVSFIRVDVLENWRFWHSFKDYAAAGKEVIAQANALLAMDTESNERAARLLKESLEFKRKKQESGRLGGIAKSRKSIPADSASSRPSGMPEFYEFVDEANLSEADSREWLDRTKENGWKDGKGRPIADWRKACEAYCARRAINRMAKGET